MINKDTVIISSFVSHAQVLLPIMQNRLFGDPHQKIAISKSLSLQKSFIVPIEQADAECITLEDFFSMLDARIDKEFAYREEITQLKNNLCEEFNKLCDGANDASYIKFVRDQRQKIINIVFDETKVDKKIIADNFFNDIMNGFEEEALDLIQFSNIVHTILWKPLLTPFPIQAWDLLQELMEELGNERSSVKIEKITAKLMEHIKNHMKVKEINDSDYKSREELREVLEELTKARQICSVAIYGSLKNESIVKEFRGKCIENIRIIIDSKAFLEIEIKINYEELILSGRVEGKDFKALLNKIQKKVCSLKMELGNKSSENSNEMGKTFLRLKDLKCLNIDHADSNVGDEGTKTLSAGLKHLKNISTLDLNLSESNVEPEGVKTLSAGLKELKKVCLLNLNLRQNNIGDEGAKALSIGLKQLIKIFTLDLNLCHNRIEADGARALSGGLKHLHNVSNLNLNLSWNCIGDEGAKALSVGLKELNNISSLNLDLGRNNIGDDGATSLSGSLKQLKNMSTLNLDLFENIIGDKGAIAFSACIKQLTKISALDLILWRNNIQAESKTTFNEIRLSHPNYNIYLQ